MNPEKGPEETVTATGMGTPPRGSNTRKARPMTSRDWRRNSEIRCLGPSAQAAIAVEMSEAVAAAITADRLRCKIDDDQLRASFSGVVQGACEDCGDCDEDKDGMCACDRVVEDLIGALRLVQEDPD